ncbi:MAG: hypothetical protein HC837_19005, partial [Chloroflexaceae bacterium]|nr:hypothetical protein [Chloroflexaceae bacterium]
MDGLEQQHRDAVLALLNTGNWDEKQRIVETQHALLLTDEADRVLTHMLQQYQSDADTRKLQQHRTLLRRCRKIGIAAAFAKRAQHASQPNPQATAERAQHASQSNPQAALAITIQQWIATPNWDESERYLQQHPELLTDEAQQLLDQMLQMAQQLNDENAIRMFQQHRTLLRRCRNIGIAAAFAERAQPALPAELAQIDPAL